MDFWKWPFMQCVTQLLVNENILQSLKSESAPCIKLLAASENLGSWFAASLSYEAMTLQAVFLHEGTSQNWFRTGFWGSVTF